MDCKTLEKTKKFLDMELFTQDYFEVADASGLVITMRVIRMPGGWQLMPQDGDTIWVDEWVRRSGSYKRLKDIYQEGIDCSSTHNAPTVSDI